MKRILLRSSITLGLIAIIVIINTLFLQRKTVIISTPNGNISAFIADTQSERTKGLSGRKRLSDNEGMLFVYKKSQKQGIWMKYMKFDIDIIWLDDKKKIVDIMPNISPSTYPSIFSSKVDASYVLELNAGQVAKRGMSPGTQLSFTTMVD